MSKLKNNLNDYELWRCTANGCETTVWLQKSDRQLIALVELPGHGDSTIPNWSDLENLRVWSHEVVFQIERKFPKQNRLIFFHGITGNGHGLHFLVQEILRLNTLSKSKPQTLIIAHSFGCYAISARDAPHAIFLNPVPHTTSFYQFLQNIAVIRVLQKVYYARWFVVFRLWWLLKGRSRPLQKARFLARYESNISADRQIYQEKLRWLSGQNDIFAGINPRIVIFGVRDRLTSDHSRTKLLEVFPESDIFSVRAGHLAPVEVPDKVARLIKF